MTDAMRTACPACGCPDQWVNLVCGFCGAHIPVPAESMRGIGNSSTIAEVIGYRGWHTHGTASHARLHSPCFPMVWQPGGDHGDGWYWAQCKGVGAPSHQPDREDHWHYNEAATPDRWVPVKDCGGSFHGCGFYAGRTRAHLIDLGYGRYSETHPAVIGQIQMAGKIIPATNGFRAQKVFIKTIYVPHELWRLARDLEAVYAPHGAAVELSTTLILPPGQAIEWCQKCGSKMRRHTHKCPFCGFNHQ